MEGDISVLDGLFVSWHAGFGLFGSCRAGFMALICQLWSAAGRRGQLARMDDAVPQGAADRHLNPQL